MALCLLAVALSACAGALPWNPQGYAGITHVELEYAPITDELGRVTDYRLARIVWWDGKERQSVSLNADILKGTVGYRASGVQAFAGQAARAELEHRVAEAAKQAGVEIAPKILDVLLKALGLP